MGTVARRVAAGAVDAAVVSLLAALLSPWLGNWLASRAELALRMGADDTWWRGGLPLMLGAVGNVTYGLPVPVLLVLLPEALFGSTPGKAALGLRVSGRSPWLRFLVKSAPAWLALTAFLLLRGELFVVSIVVGIALAVGTGGMFLPPGLALHDRWSGTQVRPVP